MSFFKKYFSYLNVINEKKYESAFNGTLEINWVNGKKVLDTKNTNYSYGNLGKVLNKALQNTASNFLNEDNSVLVLGMGAGDVIKQLIHQYKSKAHITAVEIDPVIIEIAIKEFEILPTKSLEIIQKDAEGFLKYNNNCYDVIIVDLFTDIEIPDFVFNQNFITNIFNKLKSDGTVIFNTFILDDYHNFRNRKFLDRLNQLFKVNSFNKLYGHNHLIIAQKTKK